MTYKSAEIKSNQWYKLVETENEQYIETATVTPIDSSEITLENMVYKIDPDDEDNTEMFNKLYNGIFIKIN